MHRNVKNALARWQESTVTEAAIQRAIVKLLTVMQNQGLLRFFAVPNGGSRNVIEAVQLKKQGVVAGAPDLMIFLPNGRCVHAEIKTPKGTIRKSQRDWAEWCKANGHAHYFIRSFEQFEQAMKTEMGKHDTTPTIPPHTC